MNFPVNKDPNQIFIWLDKQLSILEACGGKTDEIFLRQVFETGLESSRSANAVFEVGDFWFIARGQLNSLKKFDLETVKNTIWDFWEAHRNKRISVDKTTFDPIKKIAAAYNVSGKKEKSRCDHCSKFR